MSMSVPSTPMADPGVPPALTRVLSASDTFDHESYMNGAPHYNVNLNPVPSAELDNEMRARAEMARKFGFKLKDERRSYAECNAFIQDRYLTNSVWRMVRGMWAMTVDGRAVTGADGEVLKYLTDIDHKLFLTAWVVAVHKFKWCTNMQENELATHRAALKMITMYDTFVDTIIEGGATPSGMKNALRKACQFAAGFHRCVYEWETLYGQFHRHSQVLKAQVSWDMGVNPFHHKKFPSDVELTHWMLTYPPNWQPNKFGGLFPGDISITVAYKHLVDINTRTMMNESRQIPASCKLGKYIAANIIEVATNLMALIPSAGGVLTEGVTSAERIKNLPPVFSTASTEMPPWDAMKKMLQDVSTALDAIYSTVLSSYKKKDGTIAPPPQSPSEALTDRLSCLVPSIQALDLIFPDASDYMEKWTDVLHRLQEYQIEVRRVVIERRAFDIRCKLKREGISALTLLRDKSSNFETVETSKQIEQVVLQEVKAKRIRIHDLIYATPNSVSAFMWIIVTFVMKNVVKNPEKMPETLMIDTTTLSALRHDLAWHQVMMGMINIVEAWAAPSTNSDEIMRVVCERLCMKENNRVEIRPADTETRALVVIRALISEKVDITGLETIVVLKKRILDMVVPKTNSKLVFEDACASIHRVMVGGINKKQPPLEGLSKWVHSAIGPELVKNMATLRTLFEITVSTYGKQYDTMIETVVDRFVCVCEDRVFGPSPQAMQGSFQYPVYRRCKCPFRLMCL